MVGCFPLFFCVKQNTAYELRISYWSSAVCSSDLCRMPATADCLHGGGRTCPTSPATCCWSAFPAPLEHGSRSQRIATAEALSLRGMQFSKVRLSAICRDARRLLRVPGNAGHAPNCIDTTIAAHLFHHAMRNAGG